MHQPFQTASVCIWHRLELKVVKNAAEESVASIFRKSEDEVIWCNKAGYHIHNNLTLEVNAYHVTDKPFHFYGASVHRLCVISHFRRGVNNVFALLGRKAALVGSYLLTFWDSLSLLLQVSSSPRRMPGLLNTVLNSNSGITDTLTNRQDIFTHAPYVHFDQFSKWTHGLISWPKVGFRAEIISRAPIQELCSLRI
jgi:hypothetical protein